MTQTTHRVGIFWCFTWQVIANIYIDYVATRDV